MIKKIHHVGIAVGSLDEALVFYRDILGLTVHKTAEVASQGGRATLLPFGHSGVELLEPLTPEGPLGRFLGRRGAGLHHICFETDDVAAELERARRVGIEPLDQQPQPGPAGLICFLQPHSNHGALVELAQPIDQMNAPGQMLDLHQLAVLVKDLDTATTTFCRNFALEVQGRQDVPQLNLRHAFLSVGPALLELRAPLDQGAYPGTRLAQNGEGLYRMVLRAADLDAILTQLRSRGVKVSNPSYAHDVGAPVAAIRPTDSQGAEIMLMGSPEA